MSIYTWPMAPALKAFHRVRSRPTTSTATTGTALLTSPLPLGWATRVGPWVVRAADYDNDGDLDLYVTNFGRNTFYQNRGDGTFVDVTEKAGGGDERWGVGCAFGDADLDGYVDLYVANYIDFSRDYTSTVPCVWKTVDIFCGPRGLLPAEDVFYRNNGDGTWADHSEEAGIASAKYYGYGVVFGDFDRNGWPDIFVANDSAPNNLYQNQGDGTFVDEGLSAGVAYSGDGTEQGCMGAAVGDYNNDGYFDIFVTNFEGEYNILYKNQGGEFFLDVSFVSRVAAWGIPEVGWGAGFFDFDNDGDQDLFAANGHTYPQADLPHTNSSYAEPNFLYQNLGDGTFTEVSARAGPGFALVEVSRGTQLCRLRPRRRYRPLRLKPQQYAQPPAQRRR